MSRPPQGVHDESRSAAVVSIDVGSDHVALVEVHRPPDNFFDVEMIGALAEAYRHLADNTSARAIVLCSEGKNFCAGAKFSPSGAGLDGAGAAIPDLYRQAAAMMRGSLPVVAAVQGAAVGGGLGLACSADFRVATPTSKFSANFARLGFHHGFALTVTLPGIVGQQRSNELLYTGRRIDGDTAYAMGLVDRLVPVEQLRDTAIEFAREIAASAPLAVRSIRETMRRGLIESLEGALQRESDEQARLRTSSDWAEGVLAMSERRQPNFESR